MSRDASRRAATALGMRGDLVTVRFAGESVDALIVRDLVEQQRLIEQGLGPVLDRDLLDVLAVLPYELPTPWQGLDDWQKAVLSTAPAGLVADRGSCVVRIWRPVAHVEAVLACGRSNGLNAVTVASWFWCHCRRVAVVTADSGGRAQATAAARRHGVGLAVLVPEGVELIVPPAATSPIPGPRHWRFLEACYAAWSEQARTQAFR